MNSVTFFFAIFVFSAFLIVVYGLQVIQQYLTQKRQAPIANILQNILQTGETGIQSNMKSVREWILVLDKYIQLSQTITPTKREQENIMRFFVLRKADVYFIRKMNSSSVFQRCRAAFYLGYLETVRTEKALRFFLQHEANQKARLYLIYSICRLEISAALPDIIDSLRGNSIQFIKRISGFLVEFPSAFTALFPMLENRQDPEIILLIIEFARMSPYRIFSDYLVRIFLNKNTTIEIRKQVFQCLMESYPYALNPANFLDYSDSEIELLAIEAMGDRPTRQNVDMLIKQALKGRNVDRIITSLSQMVQNSPSVFLYLAQRIKTETNRQIFSILVKIVAVRFEYFLPLLTETENSSYESIVNELISEGKVSGIISFLNDNHDVEIENLLVKLIQKKLREQKKVADEFRIYLKDSILQKIGISRLPLPQKATNKKNEHIGRLPLFILLALILLSVPLLFIYIFQNNASASVVDVLGITINNFLTGFGVYALIVNFFYFFLIFLALHESEKQYNYYTIKPLSFLFQKNMLPSISIISPAFCEAETIIDSVESLLNLNYPDFEVIVVNDGSTDKTRDILISYFHLEKQDLPYDEKLQTQPIRGIYANPHIPKLKVIDKINGGKADSLNAGINIASSEYILGTDSDCILERDSLLHMTAPFIDEDKMVVASGGNIMPGNGCTINQGVLIQKRLPNQLIPLLQTIEYLRAFINGRMGWSRLHTLMIISGAFGIFRREQVIAINGYLTSKEKYIKDTVGEDMELVIRLTRSLRENATPHRILFNSSATCWTEVPHSLPVLMRQRNRWQRGLIDILLFHKKMICNPRYGTYGLLGFPYYMIVEVIGPWFELISLILFIVGVACQWITPSVLLFFIATNFMLGFAVSLASLYILEKNKPAFSFKERIVLLFVSLVETFGFRQIISFFRVSGYIAVLFKARGWNKFARKGFRKQKREEVNEKK